MEATDETTSLAGWRRWLRARSKTALAVAVVSGRIIFWGVAAIFAVPSEYGHDGSLLGQPAFLATLAAILAAAVGLGLTSLLWWRLLGRGADPLLTIFAAAAGLTALSCRAGTMTDLLQSHGVSVFITLCVEQVLLAACLLGCWWLLVRFDTGKAPIEELKGGRDPLMAMLLAALVMGICVWFLAPVDAKKQVLMAVGVGGFAGSAVAYASLEIDAGLYYVIAPLLLGVGAYLLALFNPGVHRIGVTGQPLAYPLPLDYASVGVVGSLLGFWTAQAWRLESM